MNAFKPGDYVLTKEYGERVVIGVKGDIVEVDVNFLPEPVKYSQNQLKPVIKYKVGSILTLPLGIKAEVVKVTDEYVIFDVPNHDPVKLRIKDIKLFQTLEQ